MIPQLFQQVLSARNFEKPTHVQLQTWKGIRAGNNVLAVAKTGSGKTLAYTLPAIEILQNVADMKEATLKETTSSSNEKLGPTARSDSSSNSSSSLKPVILCLVPTRELASQVKQEANFCGRFCKQKIRAAVAYGGVDRVKQAQRLQKIQQGGQRGGALRCFLAATPGRLIDLAQDSVVSFSRIKMVILDEADRLIQKSLLDQTNTIRDLVIARRNAEMIQVVMVTATNTPELKQTFECWRSGRRRRRRNLVVASSGTKTSTTATTMTMTMDQGKDEGCNYNSETIRGKRNSPRDVAISVISDHNKINKHESSFPKMSQNILRDSYRIKPQKEHCVTSSPKSSNRVTAEDFNIPQSVEQIVHVCAAHKKLKKLIKLLRKVDIDDKSEGQKRHRQPTQTLIFCNKIKNVESVWKFLIKNEHKVARIHGKIHQEKREKTLAEFRAGKIRILIATNVASRGLHIKNLRSVVNYDFPTSLEEYVHRVGRTGRSGNRGKAWSFFTRNLLPLAPSIVNLLAKTGQFIDPNLANLAKAAQEEKKHKSTEEYKESDATHNNTKDENHFRKKEDGVSGARVADSFQTEKERDINENVAAAALKFSQDTLVAHGTNKRKRKKQPNSVRAAIKNAKAKRKLNNKRKRKKQSLALDCFGIDAENNDTINGDGLKDIKLGVTLLQEALNEAAAQKARKQT